MHSTRELFSPQRKVNNRYPIEIHPHLRCPSDFLRIDVHDGGLEDFWRRADAVVLSVRAGALSRGLTDFLDQELKLNQISLDEITELCYRHQAYA